MIKFLMIDFLVVAAAGLGGVYAYLHRKRKPKTIDAFFVSGYEGIGPLDGTHRNIDNVPAYIYTDEQGVQHLYRSTGNDIYSYSGEVGE